MKTVYILLAEGFEELETIAPADLLRRAGAEVKLVSVNGAAAVRGARGVTMAADLPMAELDFNAMDMVVLPGGYPGYENLGKSPEVAALLRRANDAGKWIAAICGAPSVLGGLGLLKGRSATCYPGMEETLEGAQVLTDPVVESENIITSRGAGTAVDFALALVARVASPEKAAEIARGIVYA